MHLRPTSKLGYLSFKYIDCVLIREYPCDHVAMLNVTLLYTGCPRTNTHEVALQLLQLLYKRFFMDDVVMTDAASAESEVMRRQALNDMLLSGPYYRPQLYLSETLARWHPELTMPIFSGKATMEKYTPLYLTVKMKD